MKQQAQAATVPHWLVVEVPDGEYPQVHAFRLLEDLVAFLRDAVEQGTSRVFPFYGDRLQVSVGPWRHLLIPDRDPIPLFDLPETLLPDDSGYVGDPDDEPEGLSFESPRAAAEGDAEDGLEEIGGEERPEGAWDATEDDAVDAELEEPDAE